MVGTDETGGLVLIGVPTDGADELAAAVLSIHGRLGKAATASAWGPR